MKMDKQEKATLIESLLPLLDPEATKIPKKPTRYGQIDGRTLISQHGILQDAKGFPIEPARMYRWPLFEPVKINHRQEIGHIIAQAKDSDEVDEKLGAHLALYPADKAAVIRTVQATRN